MNLLEVVRQVRRHLEENGRVSYRMLQRQFDLEDGALEELIEELVDVQRIAVREKNALAWSAGPGSVPAPATPERDPRDYTPRHLAEKILQSRSALEGERKQVTVLFADVKGSMELQEDLDPEEWHGILDRFFEILSEGVHRFEGTVNQYLGDGIMALFGAPLAHEDHAQRACYAALHLRDELRRYADELRVSRGLNLSTRMGLNSGEVVVGKIGDDLRMDYTAQGHAVGLAQRMEQIAESGQAFLTEHTARLVEGYFELRDLGPAPIKGSRDPVGVHALVGVGEARTRLDISRTRGFSKFVGREREMQSLESALEHALAGAGQVVGVVAEAGTGKSRLCDEFVERCHARGLRVNAAHCPAHGKTVPYLPLLELLRSIFGIGDRDSDHETRRKIAGELLLLDEKFQELLPLLFDFLGVRDPERPPPEMSPEGRQRQLFAFVRDLTQARSQREPTLLLIDDLHWIDSGSDAFLAQAVEAVQGHRTLWLVNFRPEYHADWMGKSYYRQLPLQPLGREDIEELLLDLLGADASLAELPTRIYERTGGNPFFVEEVVQSLVENAGLEGSRGAYRLVVPVGELAIPDTVQIVLAARIDRLGEREKHLLQTASVIGREFPAPLLRRVAELPADELAASLAELVRAEFLLETALYPEAEYAFKHPLTQAVAYASQLGQRRARTHAAVAKAIEELGAAGLDERAARLAQHWEEASDPERAAHWHERAALWCAADNPPEALRHNQRLRGLLRELPDSSEVQSRRLAAATEILNGGWQHGLSDTEATAVFEEGCELATRSRDVRAHVLLLFHRAAIFYLSGDPEAARPLVEEASARVQEAGASELSATALTQVAQVDFYTGKLEASVKRTGEAIGLFEERGIEVTPQGVPTALYIAMLGYFQVYMGRLIGAAESLRRSERPLHELGQSGQSWWHGMSALCCAQAGDPAGALAHGGLAIDQAEKVGSSTVRVVAYQSDGAGLAANGEWAAAASRYELALDLARRTRGFLTLEPEFLAGLARCQLGLGELERARATAEEAVLGAIARGTPVFEANAQLALAEVRLALDGDAARPEIEAALQRCSELIEQTGARLYTPRVHEQRAALADFVGDGEEAERELREAHRLYTEMGATGHTDRLARELGS